MLWCLLFNDRLNNPLNRVATAGDENESGRRMEAKESFPEHEPKDLFLCPDSFAYLHRLL